MTDKIEPCPFCGAKETSLMYTEHPNFIAAFDVFIIVSIHCNNCAARGPMKQTESHAIAAWNRVATMRERTIEEECAKMAQCIQQSAIIRV